MKKTLIIFSALVLIVISIGASITIGFFVSDVIFKNHRQLLKTASNISSAKRSAIIDQLVADFQKEVSMKSCETYRDKTKHTVGDIISRYLDWMMASDSYGKSFTLNCASGERADMEICVLFISEQDEGNSHPGWSRFLKFDFNAELKEINKESYECVDTP